MQGGELDSSIGLENNVEDSEEPISRRVLQSDGKFSFGGHQEQTGEINEFVVTNSQSLLQSIGSQAAPNEQ